MGRATPRWVFAALGAASLLLAFFLARAAAGFGGEELESFTARHVYDAIKWLTVAVVLGRAWRPGRDRVAWALLGVGLALSAAGDLVWSRLYAESGDVPVPSVADVLYVTSYLPMLASVVFFLRDRVHELRSGLWLDGLLGALAVGAVFAALVLEPIRASVDGADPAVFATQVGYPLADLLLLAGFVGACALRGWRLDVRWLVLCGGMLVFVITDSIYLLQLLDGTYVAGGVLDAGWLVTALVWAIAAWSTTPQAATVGRPSRLAIAAPVTFGMAATLACLFEALEQGGRTDNVTLLLGFGAICAALARFALTTADNQRLLAATQEDAATDPLTGLANRRRLDDELRHIGPDPRVLVAFDLDGFKGYNDTFGHPAGDILLRMIGERLIEAVRGEGIAFRVGGDEFCALIEPRGRDAGTIGRRLAKELVHSGKGFHVTASYGALTMPREAQTAEQALRLADRRLYACKHSRRASSDEQSSAVLLAMLAERDPDLTAHGGHVADMAVRVAGRLGIADGEIEDVRRAAALHDIGKLAIPEAILGKPRPLDPDELQLMRQHTMIGERVLAVAPALQRVAGYVRSSHERWDGDGYPDGLAGEEIPLVSRVIFVCDAFDAMTSDRAYRAAMSPIAALAELQRCAGSQFDPAVVDAFAAELRRAPAPPRLRAA